MSLPRQLISPRSVDRMQLSALTTTRSARWSSTVRRLTLDHLWIVTVLALVWVFISLLPLPPNDLWWHMAAGRTMLQEGAWLTTNRWAYTVPYDAPYVYQSWISEIALYWLWLLGDVPLLMLARTLVITGSYGLVAWHAWRRVGQGKAVALALLLAVLIGWNNWTLRPQTLALAPGALLVIVLDGYLIRCLSARWLAAIPALMVLWVNMHGSFILGAVLVGLTWLGAAITVFTTPRGQRRDAWLRVRALTLTGLVTLIATMINPLGIGIFGYVRNLFANSSVQNRIAEWQPLRNNLNLADTGFWFFALLLLLAVLMARSPRRPSATDLLWYCGLAWLGISAGRHAIWFALFLLPLVAEQLAPLFAQRRPPRGNSAFNSGYLLFLAVGMVGTLPWFAPSRLLGPDAAHLYATDGRYRALLSSTTPVAATEWLAQHPIAGRFWTDMSYSSYTIWQLPAKQVFADLRIELFPDAIWNDYFDINSGNERSLALINKWQITHLLLDRKGQAKLYDLLRQTPGWCEPYRDASSVVIARCG